MQLSIVIAVLFFMCLGRAWKQAISIGNVFFMLLYIKVGQPGKYVSYNGDASL